jgi:tRNA threonylcarbamoyladenosine biosynthesis protein TsaE
MARTSERGAPAGADTADPTRPIAGIAPGVSAARQIAVPDAAAMRALGAVLAAVALPGDLVCLFGDLGAGKTQLAKGFGAGLGVTDTLSSPSFVLMAEYRGRLPLFHIDLYRLTGGGVAISDGLLDERQAEGVTLVEWADRLGAGLPASRLDVRIDGLGDGPRTVTLTPADARHARYLEAIP